LVFFTTQNRFFIERQQRAQVDHFGFDAFLGEGFGGFEGSVHHRGVRKNRQVAAFAAHGGSAHRTV